MGLDLVQTYGRPDSLTPQVLKDLVDTARAEGVVLFIDNLQAGVGAAAQLADEIDVDYVVFTNFPGGFDGTETWEKAIQYDIDLIVEVISKQ
jgi:zinc transport system substrate-binding protein